MMLNAVEANVKYNKPPIPLLIKCSSFDVQNQ